MDNGVAAQAEHSPRGHVGGSPRVLRVITPLLGVSLLCSAWLLSTRALHRWVLDVVGEAVFVLYLLLVVPVFAGVLLWSVVYAVRGLTTGRHLVALPLLINLLALGLFLCVPVSRPLDDLDFQVHRAAREDVVRRIESGELWSGMPGKSVAFLPPEYSRSVSDGGGQRSVTVYREDGVLHVLFYIHPSQRGLVGEHSAFLYRADGQASSLSNPYLWNPFSSERLDERWHRLVFR